MCRIEKFHTHHPLLVPTLASLAPELVMDDSCRMFHSYIGKVCGIENSAQFFAPRISIKNEKSCKIES